MANRVTRWSGTDPLPEHPEDVALPAVDRPLRLTLRGRVAVALATAVVAVGGVALVRQMAGDLPVANDPVEAAPTPTSSPTPAPLTWVRPDLIDDVTAPSSAESSSEATASLARALFETAPFVIVAPEPAEAGGAPTDRQLLTRWLAVQLRAPSLHPGPELGPLVERLGVRTAVAVGLDAQELRTLRSLVEDVRVAYPATRDPRILPGEIDEQPTTAQPGLRAAIDDTDAVRESRRPPVAAWLEEVRGYLDEAHGSWRRRGRPVHGVWTRNADPASWALRTTAAAAGQASAAGDSADPREAGVAEALAGSASIVRAGPTEVWVDRDVDALPHLLRTVTRGELLPGGGQLVLPGKLLVALYGHPEGGALGVLGEQPVDEAVERAREHAAWYQPFAEETVVPTFEIIATVASAGAGPRGDYSRRTPIETLRPWVDAARRAGVYVILDLQPGRTSFLEQAQEYVELLTEPHVGLALDPEWRLKPNQVHLRQIGSVEAAEVQAVADWLATLVRERALPQKAFVLHQFKLSMLQDRATLRLDHPELAPIVHVDGQGGQAAKDETYRVVTQLDPPPHVWWGWKNFYDEDRPGIRSPEATYAVAPRPVMISYQ